MKTLINIVLILLAAVLQISLISRITILSGTINLVLLFTLAMLFLNRAESLLWALVGGLLLDLVSPAHLGSYIVSFSIIYLIGYFLVKKIFTDPNIFLAGVFIFIASMLVDLVWFFADKQALIIVSNAIYNTFVGCIIYYFMRYYGKPQEEIKI